VSKLFVNSDRPKTVATEPEKISYWLEKLFNQEKLKNIRSKINVLTVKKPAPQKTPKDLTNSGEQTIEEKGLEAAVTDHFTKVVADKHELTDLMRKSNRILISASSRFPWDIIPNTINVEESRVTIIHRQLFASQVHSVDIKDISNIFIDTDLFVASLTIVSRTMEENNIRIINLQKKEAILARRVIEGMRMFKEKDIDTSQYSVEELISKLKEFSTTKIVL